MSIFLGIALPILTITKSWKNEQRELCERQKVQQQTTTLKWKTLANLVKDPYDEEQMLVAACIGKRFEQ